MEEGYIETASCRPEKILPSESDADDDNLVSYNISMYEDLCKAVVTTSRGGNAAIGVAYKLLPPTLP